ncbi:helix-turn-helix domain-containing protein, partial [Prevotella pallens]
MVEFYLQGRHTLLETAQKYGISVSTLQRYLKNVPQ